MKVRMKIEISGLRDDAPWPARGGEIEVGDTEGAELCANGYAEPVAEVSKSEKAVAPVAEKRGPGRPRKS